MIDAILSWAGTACLLLDMYLVGQKSRVAWVFCIIGELLWIVYSARTHLWPLLITCIAFFCLGIYNWFTWRQPVAKD